MRIVSPVLLFTALGVAQQQAPTKLADTGLAMVLPKGCEPQDVAGVRFLAVRAPGEADGMNINVTDGPPQVLEHVEPEALRGELTKVLEGLLTKYAFVEDGVRKVLGKDCYWISSTFETNGTAMRNMQVLVGTKPGFWLTFTTTTSAFPVYVKEFEAALATLTADGVIAPADRPDVRKVGDRLHIDGFSFEPPSGWAPGDPAAAMSALMFVVGPTTDGFAANVNVRQAPAIAKLDVKQLGKTVGDELVKALPDAKLLEAVGVKIGDRQCLRTRATYKLPLGRIEMVQYVIPAEPTSFVVTYSIAAKVAAAQAKAIEKSAGTIRIGAEAKVDAAPRAGGKQGTAGPKRQSEKK